jgi:hypothetical protein
MTRAPGPRSPAGNVGLGLLLLAVGRRRGFEQFGGSVQSFLSSLAPLIAFPLVGGGLLISMGGVRLGLTVLLASVCDVLIAPVVADVFCGWWRRRAAWARYATVIGWSQWLQGAVAGLLLAGGSLAQATGVSADAARLGVAAALFAYVAWLNWFIARHALGLSRGRAALLAAAVIVMQAAVVQGPASLAVVLQGKI